MDYLGYVITIMLALMGGLGVVAFNRYENYKDMFPWIVGSSAIVFVVSGALGILSEYSYTKFEHIAEVHDHFQKLNNTHLMIFFCSFIIAAYALILLEALRPKPKKD